MKELYCEKSYRDGKLCSERYYKDSTKQELHREDGPAKIEYWRNGNKKLEVYYIDGKQYREDGPARIFYYGSGNIDSEEYYKEGVLHREDGPAYTQYYKNGNKKYDKYYIEGKLHREDGIASTHYYENGNKKYEGYYIEGNPHREDGPASTYYYENGNKKYDKYYIEGELHREDGPANIWYDKYGVEHRKVYYINGEQQDAEYIKNNIEKNKQNIVCDKSYDRNINDFIGRTVRHFKGNEYLVLCTALNTESDEIMVIYKSLYGENITYARPLKMFMEEVPANKENPTGQKYRFQLAYL